MTNANIAIILGAVMTAISHMIALGMAYQQIKSELKQLHEQVQKICTRYDGIEKRMRNCEESLAEFRGRRR